jgi:magnesium-transporting ATPase (P-type)
VNEEQGSGWILFAGIMILIAGILNVVYGIAAIDNSQFFAGHTEFIVSSLKTWGWIILILGVLQVLAAFSIWAGGAFGAVFGIFAASLSAIGALLSIPAYPFWSLAIFAIDVLIIYGLAAYGARGRPTAAA